MAIFYAMRIIQTPKSLDSCFPPANLLLAFISYVKVELFFYDIFWVFFTPVMVSVAKSFDAPIKVS